MAHSRSGEIRRTVTLRGQNGTFLTLLIKHQKNPLGIPTFLTLISEREIPRDLFQAPFSSSMSRTEVSPPAVYRACVPSVRAVSGMYRAGYTYNRVQGGIYTGREEGLPYPGGGSPIPRRRVSILRRRGSHPKEKRLSP